jgi:hypothetical protein
VVPNCDSFRRICGEARTFADIDGPSEPHGPRYASARRYVAPAPSTPQTSNRFLHDLSAPTLLRVLSASSAPPTESTVPGLVDDFAIVSMIALSASATPAGVRKPRYFITRFTRRRT